MNARVTDGPARSAMAAAVRTNRPAPMMAPMPSATSDHAPSVRLSAPSPVAADSAMRRSIDLVLKSEPATRSPHNSVGELRFAGGAIISSLQNFQVLPAPDCGVTGEQVRNDRHRFGAGVDDLGSTIECDAPDRNDGLHRRARHLDGPPHAVEADDRIGLLFAGGRKHR